MTPATRKPTGILASAKCLKWELSSRSSFSSCSTSPTVHYCTFWHDCLAKIHQAGPPIEADSAVEGKPQGSRESRPGVMNVEYELLAVDSKTQAGTDQPLLGRLVVTVMMWQDLKLLMIQGASVMMCPSDDLTFQDLTLRYICTVPTWEAKIPQIFFTFYLKYSSPLCHRIWSRATVIR